MAVAAAVTGDGFSETENDVVSGYFDFRGRPSVRSKSGCWKSSTFIIGVEMAERFSMCGISSNLVNYLTVELGQSTAAAAANSNVWQGTVALSPVLGAFIADSFLRYQSIIISSVLYILGLGLLFLSAAINSIDSSTLAVFFFVSIYFVALAEGGHKPCIQAFGADQFDLTDKREREMKSSFFNWFYWFSCFGTLLAFSVVNYIQENLSWEIGFLIPCIVMCFALIVFWSGTYTYRFQLNGGGGNLFGRMGRGFAEAARKWQPGFAAISNELEAQRVSSHECGQFDSPNAALLTHHGTMEDDMKHSTHETNKTKAILKLAPIWVTSLANSIVFAQPSTLFIKQATTLDRRIASNFQIPAASLQLCQVLASMVFVSIYDRVFVPLARKITKMPSGISMLQRIGAGFLVSLISIIIAALVEMKRLAIAFECGLVDAPGPTLPMSVWWLAPQYALVGIANALALAGHQEFFYDQVPSNMKSMGLSLYLSIIGIGSLLSSFLVSVIDEATRGHGRYSWFSDNLNRAHLDYFYWLLAGISAFSLGAYVYYAKSYVYIRRITS